MNHQRNHRKNQQQMNEKARDMKHQKAADPQHKQDQRNSEKRPESHGSSSIAEDYLATKAQSGKPFSRLLHERRRESIHV
jgi:hypothetical protein